MNTKKGFTLVETIVAIAVLMIGIVPIFVVSGQSISTINSARDEVIATFLAQDAMEYILAKRDWNKNAGDWLADFDNCFDACRVDTTESVEGADGINSSEGDKLKFDSDRGYNYDAGEETRFSREVTFEIIEPNGGDISEATEIMVTVKMEWPGRVFGRDFEINTLIFDYSS